jgi:hypothetical protein
MSKKQEMTFRFLTRKLGVFKASELLKEVLLQEQLTNAKLRKEMDNVTKTAAQTVVSAHTTPNREHTYGSIVVVVREFIDSLRVGTVFSTVQARNYLISKGISRTDSVIHEVQVQEREGRLQRVYLHKGKVLSSSYKKLKR